MTIKKGDKVKVEYEGKLEDGTVFDSTEKHGGEPLEFEVGGGQMIPGFDKAVEGMDKGQEKDIKLEPSDAYGDHNPALIKDIPKENVPENVTVGAILGMNLPNGQQIPAKVIKMGDKSVTIDLNHPLAGKKLQFHVKVVDVSS
jgi:FKBP-type peptidyl-prolyl cis-trans isomerase 2